MSVKPDPDPTVLTTQSLLREIQNLRELMDARNVGADLLNMERFKSVDRRFAEHTERVTLLSLGSKEAIAAALQAVTNAGAKSEQGFTKQIDGLGGLLGEMRKGLEDKIIADSNRITVIEGTKKGIDNAWGYIVGAGGLLLAAWALFHNGVGQ